MNSAGSETLKYKSSTYLFHDIVNKHAPMKTLSCKQKKLSQTVDHEGTIIANPKKRKMYKTHFLNGTDTDKKDYKIFANKLTKSKNIAKRKYF